MYIHCKNSFGINLNYLSLKRSLTTVGNKADLDSGIKTKNSNLALYKSLFRNGMVTFYFTLIISESVDQIKEYFYLT